MNSQALIKAKRELYLHLLLKALDDLTSTEIAILHNLSKDRDIQDHLNKHRQADMAKKTN